MSARSRKEKKKKIAPREYRDRTYRRAVDSGGLVSSFVTVRETDLHIMAPRKVEDEAYRSVLRFRNQLENYIAEHDDFLGALVPLPVDALAPPMVREMMTAAAVADVGPMAAVAGAIAEYVARDLLASGLTEVVVENGGDIFMHRVKECIVSVFAGQSPLSQRVGLRIPKQGMPLAICTSSGTVGHSLSLGNADSVTVLAAQASLADAAATRLGNEVAAAGDLGRALEIARTIAGISGVVIIRDEELGAWGGVDLVRVGGGLP